MTRAKKALATSICCDSMRKPKHRCLGLHAPTEREDNMHGFIGDIEHLTDDSEDFRHVVYTGVHLQLVLMTLAPGEDIGEEVHLTHDQFFRVETGKGHVVIDGEQSKIKKDFAVIVPAGARHNIVNSGEKSMRLYTLYAPPRHKDGFMAATRELADKSLEKFDGVASE